MRGRAILDPWRAARIATHGLLLTLFAVAGRVEATRAEDAIARSAPLPMKEVDRRPASDPPDPGRWCK